jgi:adenylylsulfate kinase
LKTFAVLLRLANCFLNCGIITLNSFCEPNQRNQDFGPKNIIGETDFVEVYVNAPLEVCEARDVKRLVCQSQSGFDT